MSAFDKIIGYEKEKEELYQLCDMAKSSRAVFCCMVCRESVKP